MEIIGLCSSFNRISLGLIGGGGSILTVPVLVYLFGIDAFLLQNILFYSGNQQSGRVSYLKRIGQF
jgi:uncharacterized membrane protein YfcA